MIKEHLLFNGNNSIEFVDKKICHEQHSKSRYNVDQNHPKSVLVLNH